MTDPMIELHPQILTQDGKEEFVVLSFEEFSRLQEELEDYEDLRALREAKAEEATAPTLSLSEVKEDLDLS